MIFLQANIKVKHDKREEFIESVQKVISATLKEEGNASYRLFEEVNAPNNFVMLEQWKDQAAIDFHNCSPHFQEFFELAKEILAEPLTLTRLEEEK